MDMVYNAKLEAIYLATVISAEEKGNQISGSVAHSHQQLYN